MYTFDRDEFSYLAGIVADTLPQKCTRFANPLYRCVALELRGSAMYMRCGNNDVETNVEMGYIGDDGVTHTYVLNGDSFKQIAQMKPYGIEVDGDSVIFVGHASRYRTRLCEWSLDQLPTINHSGNHQTFEFGGPMISRALKECLGYAKKTSENGLDSVLLSVNGEYVVLFGCDGQRAVEWRLGRVQDVTIYDNGKTPFVVIPRKAAELAVRAIGKRTVWLKAYDETGELSVDSITIKFTSNGYYPNRNAGRTSCHVVCRVDRDVALTFLKAIARRKRDVTLRDVNGACECSMGDAVAVIGSWNPGDVDFCGVRVDSKHFSDLLKASLDRVVTIGINSFGRGRGSVVAYAYNDVVYRGVAATKVFPEEDRSC